MGVVEIVEVAGDRVYRRGAEHVEPLAPADQPGLRRAAHLGEDAEHGGDGRLGRGAERAADEVEERALGVVAHRLGHRRPRRAGDEAGEDGAGRRRPRHRQALAA